MKRASKDSPTAACPFCGDTFKARGLKRHQHRCRGKGTELEEPQYRFMIGGKPVFERILSFLNNQGLTRLQSITGDHYKACEPNFARICCPCTNDIPGIFGGRCSSCASKKGYKALISATQARARYGLDDLTGVPSERRNKRLLYARADLDLHVLDVFGSQEEWLRSLATRDAKARERAAAKQKKIDEHNSVFAPFPEAFKVYMKQIRADIEPSELPHCSRRFLELSAALNDRGLEFRSDSCLCTEYVVSEVGRVSAIVDSIEEAKFIVDHTAYSEEFQSFQRTFLKFGALAWFGRRNFTYQVDDMGGIGSTEKMELCVEYLADSGGLTLPRKWESCRWRFDAAITARVDLTEENTIRYICLGI